MTELIAYTDRKDPRFVFGRKVEKNATLRDALEDAGMVNWNVRTEPVFTGEGLELPGHQAVVGEVEGQTRGFAVMKSRYTPVEYADAFGFGQAILDDSDLEVDTVGYYRDGRRGYVSFRVPQNILVNGKDNVQAYLNIISSHDGSAPVFTQLSFKRMVCSNEISGMLSDRSKARYSVRHIGADPLGALSLEQARESLGVAFAEIEGFQETVNEWADEELSTTDVDRIFSEIFPVDLKEDSARVISRMENARELAEDTFRNSAAQSGLGSNAWSLFSGVTESFQWKESAKSDEKIAQSVLDGGLDRQQRRVANAIVSRTGLELATV